MSNRFTEKAEKALNNAVKCAESFGHTYIGSEHILLSLCQTNESVASVILNKHSASAERIKRAIAEHSGGGEKTVLSPKDMTPCSRKIVENSYRISLRYNAQKIGTEHILLAALEEKESVSSRVLGLLGIDLIALTDEVQTLLRCADKNHAKPKEARDGNVSALRQHGKNLTEMAREGRIDPVIGRDKETERLIRILCRKNKNNPCLIGEAGVGKTAIVEGLAQRIAAGRVPSLLYDKEIVCVDLTSMVSGTKYRGDFEERIKSVLNEAASNKSIILFIDEIHTIVGAGAAEGAIDAANILKPQLSRGELQIIGATTFSEYRKYIEKDAALERRFQPITVEEPTLQETKRIIYGVRERYEAHHNVKILDSAIEACVDFSHRYIQDRFLPDKALDILDETCAKANVRPTSEEMSQKLAQNIKQFENDKKMAVNNGDFAAAKRIRDLEISYLRETKNDDTVQVDDIPSISESDVKEIINEMTGIPVSGIGMKSNKSVLIERLGSRIIGQEKAIRTISNAVMRSESGVCSPEKPKGIYLFVGGSGVGKTELAKELAKELFFDKNAFFKFDMSEFSESNSVTKLIGSPPGYAGYDEGGALTERVRRHPYSILLFDEIEKAHIEILDLFLQIADSGMLTDSSGRTVSFKNCYIIFTSNLYGIASRENAIGFVSKETEAEEKNRAVEELSKHFRIEFINRIDEIVIFSKIELGDMKKIAEEKLSELKIRVFSIGVDVAFSDGVAALLAEEALDEKFGVRKLLRIISRKIENPLSEIISEKDENASRLKVSVGIENGRIIFNKEDILLGAV